MKARTVVTRTAITLAILLAGKVSGQTSGVSPDHYIYFGLERDRISESSFLATPAIAGAQLKYTWRELEPDKGVYDFGDLRSRLDFLERNGKKLFVQIQDVSFSEDRIVVPDYLLDEPEFNGGVALKYEFEDEDEDEIRPIVDGWVARRWDTTVQQRIALLLQALGEVFDGRLEGINLAETSIGFGDSGKWYPAGFSNEAYSEGVKNIMASARAAFPTSIVIQYANFMPGEWLPYNDSGYLEAVYAAADSLGVGVGGPDLMPFRRGQQNHGLKLIAGRPDGQVAGLAVQRGNLDEIDPETGFPVTVDKLATYARDVLRLDYVFWGVQEPHYSESVLPYLKRLR